MKRVDGRRSTHGLQDMNDVSGLVDESRENRAAQLGIIRPSLERYSRTEAGAD